MKNCSTSFAFALLFGLALPSLAADTPQPVRMGSGLMTFDTVPGWGLGADGKSVIGPCHGSVVVDKDGNIYTSAHAGVFVFSPEGKVIRSFLGDRYSDIHDMKIREEAAASSSTAPATRTPRGSSSTPRPARSCSSSRSRGNRAST